MERLSSLFTKISTRLENSKTGVRELPTGENSENMAHRMETDALPDYENVMRMFVHEIRNPLTAISAANALLEKGIGCESAETLKRLSGIISASVSKTEAILKRIVNLNPSELCDLGPTEVCHLIDVTLRKAEDRLFLNDVQVIRNYDSGQMIYGNAEMLSLAFSNLVVNAVEAMKPGKSKLWITVYAVAEEVRVVFKDNGCGMPQEIADRMFDDDFSNKPTGLGIGLAHVKQIITAHNATIAVNTIPNVGTSVVISFRRI